MSELRLELPLPALLGGLLSPTTYCPGLLIRRVTGKCVQIFTLSARVSCPGMDCVILNKRATGFIMQYLVNASTWITT